MSGAAMEKNENFPKRLQRLRERKGVSRRVLSELCGLSMNVISNYERGKRRPNADAICALADYFGVSADYLLCRTSDKN